MEEQAALTRATYRGRSLLAGADEVIE